MTLQEPKFPMKAAVAAMIGAVAGIAIGAWWLAPKHSPEELRIAEAELRSKMDREDMAADIAALKERCAEGQVKATPTGRIGECKGGRWTAPGALELDAKLKLKAISEQPSSPAKP